MELSNLSCCLSGDFNFLMAVCWCSVELLLRGGWSSEMGGIKDWGEEQHL